MADLGLPQVSTPPLAYDCYRFSPEQLYEKPEEVAHRENLDDLVTEAVHLLTGKRPKSPPPEPIPQISMLLGLPEKKNLSPRKHYSFAPTPSTPFCLEPQPEANQKNTCYAQLSMLLFWSPTLETLTPQVKEMIWNICLCVPSFQNYSRNSFRETVFSWMTNPESHRISILILFSAVGYLIHHGILPNIFFYPNTRNPVFPSQSKHSPEKRKRDDLAPASPGLAIEASPKPLSSSLSSNVSDPSMVFFENVKRLQSSILPQSRPIVHCRRQASSPSVKLPELRRSEVELPPLSILPPLPRELKVQPDPLLHCRESLPPIKRPKTVMDVSSLIC